MVNLFFSKEPVDGYRSAQESIRKCVDNLNKDKAKGQFRRFMEEATAEEKALVLETYFGNYSHRHFKNVGHALVAARFLGQMGAYREVGVTISYKGKSIYANLTLGDMHSVSSEHHGSFYLMHTHPELFRAKSGEVMGENRHSDDGRMATVYLSDTNVMKDTLNVLFSRQDLNLTVREAQHFASLQGDKATETPWYNPKTRTFTTWVIYKYGMARMDVVLAERGGVEKTKITFGVMTDQEAGVHLNSAYMDSQRRLSREAQKIGVSLEFEKVPYKQISSEYSY